MAQGLTTFYKLIDFNLLLIYEFQMDTFTMSSSLTCATFYAFYIHILVILVFCPCLRS